MRNNTRYTDGIDMSRNDILLIAIVSAVLIFAAFMVADMAYGVTENPIATAFHIFAEGQGELILQNDQILQQNEEIIQLLKGDRGIFVPGLTDRYDLQRYTNQGICTYYDRLLQVEVENGTCPVTNLTKDQFDALISGEPEN